MTFGWLDPRSLPAEGHGGHSAAGAVSARSAVTFSRRGYEIPDRYRDHQHPTGREPPRRGQQIGRAARRERGCEYVEVSVGAGKLKKKKEQEKDKRDTGVT